MPAYAFDQPSAKWRLSMDRSGDSERVVEGASYELTAHAARGMACGNEEIAESLDA